MAAKINMRLDKNEMPSQDPNVRNKNFLEVALGYTEEQALDEAARCLNCKTTPAWTAVPSTCVFLSLFRRSWRRTMRAPIR